MNRQTYFDNLRVFLIVMMVIVHVSLPYLPLVTLDNFVFVPSNANDNIIDVMYYMIWGKACIMHAFFFVSGYFFPPSYDKHGALEFLKSKFIRLGVPLLIVWSYKPLFLDRLWFYPLWYLAVLLSLSVVYVLIRKIITFKYRQAILPLHFVLIGLIVVVGLSTFYLRQKYSYLSVWTPSVSFFRGLVLEPNRFPQYLSMFVLGIVSYRYKLLDQITRRMGGIHLLIGITILVLFFVYTGETVVYYLNSRLFAVVETLFCFSFVLGLIVFFRDYVNRSNDFSRWCANQSYGAYIFHTIPLIAMCNLLDKVDVSVYLKYGLTIAVSVVGAFVLSWTFRLIPGVKRVL